MSLLEANLLLASDYAGRDSGGTKAKSAAAPAPRTEASIPQRQARHLAA
jgi:hypothetical protein